jgi:hypothetical protein
MRELYEPVKKLPAAMQNRLWFTTASELHKSQDSAIPLETAIWRRAKDEQSLQLF